MEHLHRYRWVAAATLIGLALVFAGALLDRPLLWAIGGMACAPAAFLTLCAGVGFALFGVAVTVRWLARAGRELLRDRTAD